jgi:hypothetical protein
MIYKYSRIESAISIVKSNRVKLNHPNCFNDPSDSTVCFGKEEKESEWLLIKNGLLLFKALAPDLKKSQEAFFILNKKKNELADESLQNQNNYDFTLPDELIQQEPFLPLWKSLEDHKDDTYKYFFDNARKDIQKIVSHYLVTCFSEINDSTLMWSHYADSHRGVCIEFSDPMDKGFGKVNYSTEKPVFSLKRSISIIMRDMILKKQTPQPNPDFLDNINKALFTKSTEWSYEKEKRFVAQSPESNENIEQDGDLFFYRVPKIEHVYIGCRAGGDELDHLLSLLEDRKIEYTYMKDSEDKYLIVPDLNHIKVAHSIKREETSTFQRILSDIENSLSQNCYLSAFYLSLIVPSICGNAEFPTIKDSKERYIRCLTVNNRVVDKSLNHA